MLKLLHNHIFARKLQSVFSSCPLVLPVQVLGSVNQQALREGLQAAVSKQVEGSNVTVEVCRINNSMAACSGSRELGNMFHTSNLLIGFSTPQQRDLKQEPTTTSSSRDGGSSMPTSSKGSRQPSADQRVRRGDSFSSIIGGLLKQQQPGPHIPHLLLRSLVLSALEVPQQHSVVLLGAFYKHRHYTIQQLQEWVELEELQVYGELLQAIEAPMEGLLELDSALEQLLETVDAAGGEGLVECLDYQAAAVQAPQ